jgi:hypothetical protein
MTQDSSLFLCALWLKILVCVKSFNGKSRANATRIAREDELTGTTKTKSRPPVYE